MTAIKHFFWIDLRAFDNPLFYWINFVDYIPYTESSERYVKVGEIFFIDLKKIYRFFSVKYPVGKKKGLLQVVNLIRILGYITAYLETEGKTFLEKAEKIYNLIPKVRKSGGLFLYNDFYQPSYCLRPPWVSSISQGMLISACVRLSKITGKKNYIDDALGALKVLITPVEKGGCLREDIFWFEEYPNPNNYNSVLNGNIYAILGIFDLKVFDLKPKFESKLENSLDRLLEACLDSLEKNLYKFDAGGYSFYDMIGTPADRSYNLLHCFLLEVVYRLTGKNVFKEYARKFFSYHVNYPARFRSKSFVERGRKFINFLFYG